MSPELFEPFDGYLAAGNDAGPAFRQMLASGSAYYECFPGRTYHFASFASPAPGERLGNFSAVKSMPRARHTVIDFKGATLKGADTISPFHDAEIHSTTNKAGFILELTGARSYSRESRTLTLRDGIFDLKDCSPALPGLGRISGLRVSGALNIAMERMKFDHGLTPEGGPLGGDTGLLIGSGLTALVVDKSEFVGAPDTSIYHSTEDECPVVVRDSLFRGTACGIASKRKSRRLTVDTCRFEDSSTGVHTVGAGNDPIPGLQVAVLDSSFRRVRDRVIQLAHGDHSRVEGCTIEDWGYLPGDPIVPSRNVVRSAIRLISTEISVVRGNLIRMKDWPVSPGPSETVGIHITPRSFDNHVDSNTFDNLYRAIYSTDSGNVRGTNVYRNVQQPDIWE